MTAASDRPAHSPLGASGAYRWMVCPGSVTLSRGIVDEESEHAALGTAAHALGEFCLTHKAEPWEMIGKYFLDGDFHDFNEEEDSQDYRPDDATKIDKETADSVALYIETLDGWFQERHQGNSWVERSFHCPDLHEWFYGTADFVHVTEVGDGYLDHDTGEWIESGSCILDVFDYKHGVGIVVEADDNPQLMYYAVGVLEELDLWDKVDRIRLHIFQPRGWHWQGPHRYWEISPDALDKWLFDTLLPSMNHAMVSRDTKTGDHCRFCPARQAQCPALLEDLVEYEELLIMLGEDGKGAELMSAEQVGRLMELNELAKITFKAAAKRAYGLLANGHEVPGCKLVKSRTNRELKEGAEKAAVKEFGKDAYTKPELKSPAAFDKMPGGKKFTARWAFKPEGGTTVAVESDPRKAIKRGVKSLFKPVKEK